MDNRKILIVEEEGVLALRIKSELDRLGYTVAGIYASGEEAVEGLRAEGADLVLMDIKGQIMESI